MAEVPTPAADSGPANGSPRPSSFRFVQTRVVARKVSDEIYCAALPQVPPQKCAGTVMKVLGAPPTPKNLQTCRASGWADMPSMAIVS
jgi:hypothetical protein